MEIESVVAAVQAAARSLASADLEIRVAAYNAIVATAAQLVALPHPALCPQLVPLERVRGNDYNPNRVAPPELRLLEHSIRRDGITMAIVVAPDPSADGVVVVDGFHRTDVVRRHADIAGTLGGYLPVVRLDKGIADLMAATVRHNMARGAHMVEMSAKLVTALTKHHWTNERIGKEIGMDPDEVLRMKQVTGLAEAFADREFSKAWEVVSETLDHPSTP